MFCICILFLIILGYSWTWLFFLSFLFHIRKILLFKKKKLSKLFGLFTCYFYLSASLCTELFMIFFTFLPEIVFPFKYTEYFSRGFKKSCIWIRFFLNGGI